VGKEEKFSDTLEAPLVCDLLMPGRDGEELFRSVKQSRPHLAQRFLFLTGDIRGNSRVFL